MKQLMYAVAGLFWFLLVFYLSFRFTFPGDAIADRIEAEVPDLTNGDYAVEVGDVHQWWVGARLDSVKLYENTARRGQPTQLELKAILERARVAVSLSGLMSKRPVLSGDLKVGAGVIDYLVAFSMEKRGGQGGLERVEIDSEDFPLQDLALLIPADFEGTGPLSVHLDLQATEGMRKATGSAEVNARGLLITKLEVPGVGDLGMEIPVDEIDLRVEIADGKGQIRKGEIVSPMARVQLEGEIGLRDDLDRSSLNVEIVVSDLGPEFAAFKMLLSSAERDGAYHYLCRGTLGSPSCDVNRSSRSTASRPSPRPSPSTRVPEFGTPDPSGENSADDLARRREEMRERLRQRREERDAARADREPPPTEPPDRDLEELFDENDPEELFEDEIPFEELEFEDFED